jgi:hypothetical protein
VAIADDDPQPGQGSPPPARQCGGLNQAPTQSQRSPRRTRSQRRTHRPPPCRDL